VRIKRGKRLLPYQAMRHSANGGSLERRPSTPAAPAAAIAVRTLALDGDCLSSIAMLSTAAMDGDYPRTGRSTHAPRADVQTLKISYQRRAG